MAESENASYLIVIEGIGDDVSKTAGIAWWFGAVEPPPEYQSERVLVGIPGSIESSVDPRSGSFSLSSFTFQLSKTGLVSKKLMWRQTRASYQLVGDIDESSATLTISPATSALTGQVIYIEDETLRCASYNGAGEYVVERGLFGSSAQAHDDKRSIFTAQPHHKYRFVRLGTYGEDQVITWRWRGYIADMETTQEGITLQIQCRELLSAQTNVEIARGVPNLADAPGASMQWMLSAGSTSDSVPDSAYLDGSASVPRESTSVHKRDKIAANSRRAAIYADGAFTSMSIAVDDVSNSHVYAADGASVLLLGSRPDFGEMVIARNQAWERTARAIDVREFAIWSKVLDERFVEDGHDPLSPTWALGSLGEHYRYHPLAIACALLMSTPGEVTAVDKFDVMGPGWGGNLAGYAASTTFESIKALIDRTRHLQVDELVLRWEDVAIRLWETVYTVLLRPYGFFLTFDTESNFGFDRFRFADIADYDDALGRMVIPIPRLLHWQAKLDEVVGAAAVKVGGGRPWANEPAADVQVVARGVSQRAAVWDHARAAEYDFRTQPASSVLGGEGAILDALTDLLAQQHDAPPVVTIRVDDSTDYKHGAWVLVAPESLQDAWFIDSATGEETQATDSAQFIGCIVSMRFDIATHTYVLGLLLTNYSLRDVIRWRAPSMEVTSVDAGNRRLYCSATSVFGNDTADSLTFVSGLRINLCDRRGTRIALTTFEITTVGPNFIELDDWPVTSPKAGDLVRLADVDEYAEEVHARVARSYVFLGQGDVFG